jgi:F-type H+-transporting ATPase subunit gamma
MSDTPASLRRKLSSAGDLQSVVRPMKALAASSISQYESSVRALADYHRTVELGLGACFREGEHDNAASRETADRRPEGNTIGAVVFGSDQGLVGQFNDVVADYAINALAGLRGKPQIWAVGERVRARFLEAGLAVAGTFAVPSSVDAIAPLVGQTQLESESNRTNDKYTRVYLFHNLPLSGALYELVDQRLLPLDAEWQRRLADVPWPTGNRPELLGDVTSALPGLVREYLFISLFRACAESLASENASRLAAMQRADKNIDDLLEDLQSTFHRLRQQRIDEELFDVISGYDALANERAEPTSQAVQRKDRA